VRRRSNSIFLVINVIISLAVALAVIAVYSSTQTQTEDTRVRPTIVLVVTATPDPNQPLSAAALQGTTDAQAGTLVALERALANAQAAPPVAVSGDDAPPPNVPTTQSDLPTIDPKLIPPLPQLGAGGADTTTTTTTTSEDGCQRHIVQAGDTASVIATRYSVNLSALFQLNGINDQTILQIGDVLLIPSAACEPEIPPTATPSPRPTFNLTLVAPTATLPQVNPNSQVEIVQILNPGDITAEQVEIQNLGGEINLLGWSLADQQGNLYTFPSVRLVPGSVIRVVTRAGTDTPGFLYWNQTTPIWAAGETATLSDAADLPQSVATVGGEVIDFSEGD